ncbi:MAG: hypothetical protein KAJ39_02140 [Gammaproteobacteria bacterium]|nr:hypothetical protein [Gammaproteobacteria bacterium]
MQQLKKNFVDYAFLLLRRLNHIKEMLSLSLVGVADVFCIKNGANRLSASNFAWVFGDGLVQCTNVVSLVNNPSPLTHENIQWRYSRGY